MNEPKRLIRNYYAAHHITHGAPLLFSYVRRKDASDEAVIDYYAARYGRLRGKGKHGIAIKRVMRFDFETKKYWMSDSVIRYQSYSSLAIDHLIFDFHREIVGAKDYTNCVRCETGGNRMNCLGFWKHEIMPTSEIPLNGFDGTKYKYCKYAFKDETICTGTHSYSYWAKNPYGNLPDYLLKFDINPQAMELFASKGLVRYMKESFLIRLRDDQPFAAWYRKHALEMLGKPIYAIENRARREIGRTHFEMRRNVERRLARIKWQRKVAREERAERRRIKRAEEMQKLSERKRIHDLYCQLKSICGMVGAYEVIVPKTKAEMMREGKKMHNCVGKIHASLQGVDSVVVFLHRNGKPCVDVEIDLVTFKVKQCRRVCNQNADEADWKVAKTVASSVRKTYRKVA